VSANKIDQQKICRLPSKNRPILSADKIVERGTRFILDDKIGQLVGYQSPSWIVWHLLNLNVI